MLFSLQSRVVSLAPNEWNYHIFYQLLYGLTQEDRGTQLVKCIVWLALLIPNITYIFCFGVIVNLLWYSRVLISFIVSGLFCEVEGGGEKGAVRRLFPTGVWRVCFPEICENRCN